MVGIEQRVTGTAFGATGYTTLQQADRLAVILKLEPGKTLLDIGTGPGWPGLYLAQTTGCRVISSDPTLEGVVLANERIQNDNLEAVAVVSHGQPLPLRNGTVEAVTSGDVFC